MKRIDRTVLKETGYIGLWVGIFSLLLQAVFLVIGQWNYTVLLGNLLGGAAAVANFFLMGLTVQSAVQKEEKEAKQTMRLSQTLRNLLVLVVAVVGIALPCFSTWTVLIPLFFPRIAIAMRPLFLKEKEVHTPHEE